MPVQINRYHRQTLLPQVGLEGQNRIARARVLVVGCGALGSASLEQLARCGVGFLKVVDRDIVELTNLQRQTLFDEADARDGLPKAIAAAQRLAAINSGIVVEPAVIDVDSSNLPRLAAGMDLMIDGTDNVATRYLINDYSVKENTPWIYGACIGTEGRMMLIRPDAGPCLRCIFPQPPTSAELKTCDTAGVLGAASATVGALQAAAALRLIVNGGAAAAQLLSFDLWSGRFHTLPVGEKDSHCVTCAQRRFDYLDAACTQSNVRLCGRDAVQISAHGAPLNLSEIARRFATAGEVRAFPFMVRCTLREAPLQLTAFSDGRVLVQGTADLGRARAIVTRLLGG